MRSFSSEMGHFVGRTVFWVAVLHLIAIVLSSVGVKYINSVQLILICGLLLSSAEFLYRTISLWRLLNQIVREKKGEVFVNLMVWYAQFGFYNIFVMLLPDCLCGSSNAQYKVVALHWGLQVDLGLFMILLFAFVFFRLMRMNYRVGQLTKLLKS